jgi:CRISPR-associated protein Cmr6
VRPLYAIPAGLRLDGGNAGLWYDKFCDTWHEGWKLSSDGGKAPKLSWIETVASGGTVGQPLLLSESAARLHQLTHARRGVCAIFTAESRFVTGLGRSHPVENGFAWHPTLGVPYLPGSSIKGLVRSWAEHDAEPRPDADDLNRLLGTAAAPRSAGHVVFLDAIPIAPVRLEADVMTPHYAGWTPGDPPADWPGDWREPKPVPFLAVAPQTSLLFSIVPRAIEPQALERVFRWLADVLRHAGAGAKTAVGYGRFVHDEPRTRTWSEALAKARAAQAAAARRAALKGKPEGKWLDQLDGKPERHVLDLVRIHLEQQRLEDPAERRGLARAVATTPYLALWRRGETQDRQNIKNSASNLKARARLVDAALAETDLEPAR